MVIILFCIFVYSNRINFNDKTMEYLMKVIGFTSLFILFVAWFFRTLADKLNKKEDEIYFQEYINSLLHHLDDDEPEENELIFM